MSGGWVSYWFAAFVVVLLLSLVTGVILLTCWTSMSPEMEEWQITPAGKIFLRARYLFTAACVIILACPFVVGSFDASDRSAFYLWCDAHPRSLPAVMIICSGLSIASASLAFKSKGSGRLLLMICALVVAALSISGAVFLMAALSQ